jgi:hypothetical protein
VDPPPGGTPVPTIRVRVKLNGVYHEIYINAQASFSELKKLVSEKIGLQPDDQKVVYRYRERDSMAFLDVAGIKDWSKMVLLEDPSTKARRLLEERRNNKARQSPESASTLTRSRPRYVLPVPVIMVCLDFDPLHQPINRDGAGVALETIVSKGGKVVDADVATLTGRS